jgi:hypothetical protein
MVVLNPMDVRAATIQAVTDDPDSDKLIQPQSCLAVMNAQSSPSSKRTNPREIQGPRRCSQ